MYKQTHIVSFIALSIAVHIILLAQYQTETTPVFAKNTTVFNIELSSRQTIKKVKAKKAVSKSTENKPLNKHTKKTVQARNSLDKKSDIRNKVLPEEVDTAKKEKTDPETAPSQVSNNSDASTHTQAQQPSQFNKTDNQYLQKILSIIESNKYYPGTARRRNMEDTVKVSFSLLESGEIDDLKILGKYKLLQHAAKTAILESLPFIEPPAGMRFPVKINYSMAFKLSQDH